MSKKKETGLGMFIKANNILIGDLVAYNKYDIISKARFEPLPCNKFVVRGIKVKDGETYIRVRHFILNQYVLSDKVDEFERILLK